MNTSRPIKPVESIAHLVPAIVVHFSIVDDHEEDRLQTRLGTVNAPAEHTYVFESGASSAPQSLIVEAVNDGPPNILMAEAAWVLSPGRDDGPLPSPPSLVSNCRTAQAHRARGPLVGLVANADGEEVDEYEDFMTIPFTNITNQSMGADCSEGGSATSVDSHDLPPPPDVSDEMLLKRNDCFPFDGLSPVWRIHGSMVLSECYSHV